jgi:sugar phosphate isomerase/epimerase
MNTAGFSLVAPPETGVPGDGSLLDDAGWSGSGGNADEIWQLHPLAASQGPQGSLPTSQMLGPHGEHMTEAGSGTIDWETVISTAEKAGVTHYFVERQHWQHSGVRELAHKL